MANNFNFDNFTPMSNPIGGLPEGVIQQAPDVQATDIRLQPNEQLLEADRLSGMSSHLDLIKKGRAKGYSLSQIESAFPDQFNDNTPIEAIAYKAGLAKGYTPEEIEAAFDFKPDDVGFGRGLGSSLTSSLRGVGEIQDYIGAGDAEHTVVQDEREAYIKKYNRDKNIAEARGGEWTPQLNEFNEDFQQMAMAGEVAPDVALGITTGFAGNAAKGIAMDLAGSAALEGTRYVGTEDFDQDAGTKAMVGLLGAGLGNAAVPLMSKLFKGKVVPDQLDNNSLSTLMDDLGVSADKAKEVFDAYKSISGKESLTVPEEVSLLAQSQQGKAGVTAIREAGNIDPSIITSARNAAEARGQQVRQLTETTLGDTRTAISDMQKGLDEYSNSVKKQYTVVKEFADEIAQGETIKFAGDSDLASVLSKMDSAIGHDATVAKKGLGGYLDSYSGKDLSMSNMLEMYRDINKFIRKQGDSVSAPTLAEINKAKSKVKGIIEKRMKSYGEVGDQWVKEFSDANKAYAKKAGFEDTKIFKTVTDSVNSKSSEVQSAMTKKLMKYSTEDVNALMGRLTPEVRVKVEKMMLNQISQPSLKGSSAIDFVDLSRRMGEYNFISKEANELKGVVDQFATVFKNDPDLAKLTTKYNDTFGGKVMEFATTIKGKAKMFLISRMWMRIKSTMSNVSAAEREKLARTGISNMLSDTIKEFNTAGKIDVEKIVSKLDVSADTKKRMGKSISGILRNLRKSKSNPRGNNSGESIMDTYSGLGVKSSGKAKNVQPNITGDKTLGELLTGKSKPTLTPEEPVARKPFELGVNPSNKTTVGSGQYPSGLFAPTEQPVSKAGMLGMNYGKRATGTNGVNTAASRDSLKGFLDSIANPMVNVDKTKVSELFDMLKADSTTMYAATPKKEAAWNKAMDIVNHIKSQDKVSPKARQQMIDAIKEYYDLLGSTI